MFGGTHNVLVTTNMAELLLEGCDFDKPAQFEVGRGVEADLTNGG